MMVRLLCGILLCVVLAPAFADTASSDYGNSQSFKSSSDGYFDSLQAWREYQERENGPDAIYNYNVDSTTTYTGDIHSEQHCNADGSCSSADQTNIAGSNIVEVDNGDGVVTLDIDAESTDTEQEQGIIPVVGDNTTVNIN